MSTSPYAKSAMLQSILPTGVDVYFALFSDSACTTEIAIGRVAYTGWSTNVESTRRTNTAAISWEAVVDQVTVRGCGWYDESVGGILIAFGSVGSVMNPDESEIVLETGDIAEIGVEGLRLDMEDA